MQSQGKLESMREAMDEWERTTLRRALDAWPERYAEFVTTSGEPVKRLFTPDDVAGLDYQRDLGFPGQYPFTRGVHPTMYRGRLWTMRMFAGFGSAEETNERYKYLLAKCGVAVSSLADMEMLFSGIPVDRITTSMTINGPAAVIWAMYIAAAERRGIPMDALGGTIQNDILKEYIAQKSWLLPPEPSMRLIVDTFEFGSQHLPKWNTISISGYHIREAGSTAAQELAFTLADGLTYVQAAVDRGLDVDAFAPRLSFFFNAHNDLFEEIAKYRAARRIWAREMKERFKAGDPRSWWLRFHTQTAGCSLTAQQPENNIVRTTIQALAAVLGGTQSLHTNSMDEALALPSELAARIALRTQQVIAHESGVTNSIDPLAGSYFLESLTNRLEEQAYQYFAKIDALGGVVPALEQGFLQREIAASAYRYQREIDDHRRTVVGVNEYEMDEPLSIPLLRMDPEGERRQRERLARIRCERDNELLQRRLQALRAAAQGTENLMPYILDAVRANGTLGEVCDVLREVFGEYREPVII
jgi:methylmalonyl-CoA mutase N-terminal domain/subunit